MAKDQLDAKRPVAPIDYTRDLSCPLLGLFGEEDRAPTPEQVALHQDELKRFGKNYEFHMYPGAGHGFNCDERDSYHEASAADALTRTLGWFDKYLKH